jgi:hypothetical protein
MSFEGNVCLLGIFEEICKGMIKWCLQLILKTTNA